MEAPIEDVTEQKRLNDAREAQVPWKKWGPYLSERQWGTVREDYSEDGNAWNYFTHDQARSRAYKWGEDGLGGICDDKQRLCFALALWNERDPILKERLFGLTNSEGNHGEDVKEYYFYLDSTPTHSYMKYLYKYPQREFPYRDLVETNRRRSREEFEYELLDTGVFDEDRYFDVFVEYAKEGPEDVLVRITVHNRGPEAARLRVLPTLWFRNTWSWGDDESQAFAARSGAGRHSGHAPRAGRVLAPLRWRAGAAVHREREQCAASVGPAQRVSLRQGRVPRLRDRGAARGGESRQGRDQGRGPLRPRGARRRQQDGPAAAGGRQDQGRLRRLREDLQEPHRRRRRVLRADRAQIADRRSAPGASPGAGGNAVGQAVLLLRPGALAARAQESSAARVRPPRRAQHRVVPHAQRRRHLDAGQVGVPVVRGLGPGLPHGRAGAGGFRFRQGAAAADAAQPVLPPERADSGLRVELQRREPAGACLRRRSGCTSTRSSWAGPTCGSWSARFRD